MIYCFNHSRMSIYHHAYGKNSAMVHPPQIRSSFAPGHAGPLRPAAAPADQHGGHARLPRGARGWAHRRRPPPGGRRHRPLGHRRLHRLHPRRGGLLLHRAGAHHVGVQLGDLPAAPPRARVRAGRGVEPRHQRGDLHDLLVALQGHHHRGQLLPLRGHRVARLGLLLHLPPRDTRPHARADGRALRYPQHGRRQLQGAAVSGEGEEQRRDVIDGHW